MKYIVAILLFLFPTFLVRILINISKKHNIARGVKIGFSFIVSDNIVLDACSSIGHFNILNIRDLSIRGGRINHLNFVNGKFSVHLSKKARIGNLNKISSASKICYHKVSMTLGEGSNLNNSCVLDMTDSIFIGNNTTIAGTSTQIWTHSYFKTKPQNKRLDAPVYIGNNCYIGSRCCIMPGITIHDNVVVGAQTCVHKNLDKAGLYVSQSIKFVEYDADEKIKSMGNPVYGDNIYRKENTI